MNIVLLILFGVFVGITANAISQSNKGGIVKSLLLGIVGALVGGFFANIIFGFSIVRFNANAFLIAITGSLLMLFFGKHREKRKLFF